MSAELKGSQFLRSQCCDAPVVQTYEAEPDLFPVLCRKCGTELGAPGLEDIGSFMASEWALVEQWGCGGKNQNHVGACTAQCPRGAHHHHDRKCLPPARVQVDQVGRA